MQVTTPVVTMPLSTLREGAQARVQRLHLTGAMRRRLQELGLVPGTAVRCLRRAPAGSPTAYLICGTVFALRTHDAALIEVTEPL